MNELTIKELHILDVFRKDIFLEATLSEIKKILKKKSYGWMYELFKKFKNLEILNSKKVGKTFVYSLNLDSQRAAKYLGVLEQLAIDSAKNLPLIVVDDIMKSLKKETRHFILLVTGSYALGNLRRGSDLDIVVIVPTNDFKKQVKPRIVGVAELSAVNVDYYIFSEEEVLQMWLKEEPNFGKEFFKNHLVLYGFEVYYELIKEAIHHGFQG